MTAIVTGIVLVFLGYSVYVRPRVYVFCDAGVVEIANHGKMAATLHKADIFWYWGGKVSFVRNVPPIAQTVERGQGPVLLKIPEIPAPLRGITSSQEVYMKMILRYGVQGVPIFKYSNASYFEYRWDNGRWELVRKIPAKYRALGKAGLGDIGQIDLDFQF